MIGYLHVRAGQRRRLAHVRRRPAAGASAAAALLGIGISLLAVGLASYSLAIDFDAIDRAVAGGRAGEVLLAARPRPHRHAGLALPRDRCGCWPGCATDVVATCDGLAGDRRTSSSSSSAWSSGGISCRSTTRFRVCRRCAAGRPGSPTRGAGSGDRRRRARPRARRVVMDQLTVVVYDASAAPGQRPAPAAGRPTCGGAC